MQKVSSQFCSFIDSESCVNVREWCASVNMGDKLLSMFV